MNQLSVLEKIEKNELTAFEALDQLYPVKKTRPGKRAYFIKMSIVVPDEGKGVNTFLRVLFAIPLPMIFARMGLRFGGRFIKDDDFDIKEIASMLKYSRGTMVNIDSKDAQVKIKVI